MKNDKKIVTTKQIAITAILLAICMMSQLLKNFSIYLTGPIVNTCLVLAVFTAGLPAAILLAIITPVTAFLIAASPVMTAVPLVIPLIMGGNAVLVILTQLLLKKEFCEKKMFLSVKSVVFAALTAVAKGAFMGLTISLWAIPAFLPAESKLRGKLDTLQFTFSVAQLITAAIGFVYVFLLWPVLRKAIAAGNKDA